MTDEQKDTIDSLESQARDKDYQSNGEDEIFADDARSLRTAVSMIEHLSKANEEICAENERIRQTHVPYEVYLEMVGVMAKERTEWKRKAEAMEHDLSLSRCMSCIHEQTEPCLESCVVCFDGGKYKWRGVCAENGENNATD